MTALLEPAIEPATVLIADEYGQGSRARHGERMHHLFEERCDLISAYGRARHLAVDDGDETLTYAELDARANRLARHLLAAGARAGDRVALLLDRQVDAYVGMLATLKIHTAYVPLDVAFPPDRLAYIVEDAGARFVLSRTTVRTRVPGLDALPATMVFTDAAAAVIAGYDDARLTDAERGRPVDDLAYIIYTSGSTGRPKGVAIEHQSICNFVRVAAEVYGLRERDRIYQGLTVAFDFSVEEIWVPWMVGCTLVPKPAGASLLGTDLHAFLAERRVTALCCVPTLLATIEEDLPELRFLLVSGEACPQDLISRWYRPGRRFLNVYGPTEATVTATWTEVHPERPVTIGVPLPTYVVVVLDPDDPHRALPHGTVGEIGIAGIGLAKGYLNRDDLTGKAFIPDFLGLPGNPSGRIYRTGDLGRVNEDGEIEYLGRIDLQVKIRGYRIELTEIESVLLQVPGVAAAVVDTFEPVPGTTELVAYYSLRSDTPHLDPETITATLRDRLPAYMVPVFLEQLDVIPLTPQNKADRKNLPAPRSGRRGAAAAEHVAAAGATEQLLADLLAATLGVERVSATAHLFDDLGANSLLISRFTAKVRRTDLPPLTTQDVYQNPTVAALAAHLGDGAVRGAGEPERVAPPVRGSTLRFVLAGAVQLLALLGSLLLGAEVLDRGYAWVFAAVRWQDTVLRSAAFVGGALVASILLPLVAKWTLLGRARPSEFRVWSLAYLRFWIVATLIRTSPLAAFVGSPLQVLYLRLLGAKIGRGVTLLSRVLPATPDLLTIGDRAVIGKESSIRLYRAGRRRRRNRADHPRRRRVRRPADRPRHRHDDGRRLRARPQLLAARGPVGPGGGAVARVPGPAHRQRFPVRRPAATAARCAASSTASGSCWP